MDIRIGTYSKHYNKQASKNYGGETHLFVMETMCAPSRFSKLVMAGQKGGHRKLRSEIVSNMFSNVISSIVAKSILFSIFCVAFAVIEGYYVVLILPLLVYAWNWRSIAFEIFILIHIIEEGLGTWKWYSRIDDKLYLGGIPLNSLNHLSILTMDLKVNAILSVMESYELNCSTLAGKPVSPEQWKVIFLPFILAHDNRKKMSSINNSFLSILLHHHTKYYMMVQIGYMNN